MTTPQNIERSGYWSDIDRQIKFSSYRDRLVARAMNAANREHDAKPFGTVARDAA